MTGTPLTRSEAKDLTRRRLIRAALSILDEEGEAGLSTVKVAKAAGIAQSSFYVHFKDMQELLRVLAEEGGERLRGSMREARRRAREHPGDLDLHRETFRIPLESICRHPELLRIQIRARHDPRPRCATSPWRRRRPTASTTPPTWPPSATRPTTSATGGGWR
ncbi:TetR family transcriptional regulator [Nonomuraea thailandensis]